METTYPLLASHSALSPCTTLFTKQCNLFFSFLAYGYSRKTNRLPVFCWRHHIGTRVCMAEMVGKDIDNDKVSRSTLLGSLRCFLAPFLGSCRVALQADKPALPNFQSLTQPGVILQTHLAPHLCKCNIICSAAVSTISVTDSGRL
jgi:hypothetical protein